MMTSLTEANKLNMQRAGTGTTQKQGAVVDCLEFAMKIHFSSGELGGLDTLSSSSSFTPPLDQVTTCSEDLSDDVSDVSSCSAMEDDLPETEMPSRCGSRKSASSQQRSIFKKYWGAQGGQSHKLHRPVPTEISTQVYRILCEEETPFQNTYEDTLREREDSKLGLTPQAQRRCIFTNRYQSSSTPTLRTQKYQDLRKIQSTSVLGRKPGRSCLRTSRYSASNSPTTRLASATEHSSGSENTSVHFSDKVQVTVFQTSLESFAQEGWSDYFAYR
jgi:hypothetical protein